MNHTLAIAKRELVERRFVLYAPIAAAAMIMLLPLMPHVHDYMWREIYVVGSLFLSISFIAGLSAILGASIVGREIADRRLSFYFTKPVAAPAIWFGKLIAAMLLIAASWLIGAVPAIVAGGASIRRVIGGQQSALTPILIGVVAIFFVAHIFSTIIRSRSVWAFADLLTLAVLSYACWWIAQPLLSHYAMEMLFVVAKIFGWLLLIAVIAAGAWQLAIGRTDRVQSHLALSRFLWSAIAVAVALCACIVAWVVTPRPDELTGGFFVRTAPQGAYAFVSGSAKHRLDYHPLFLMNVRNGAYERVAAFPLRNGMSLDGRRALMLRPIFNSSSFGQVVVRDLEIGGREHETDLILGGNTSLALSADGNRIAYGGDKTLTFYDITLKKSLGSLRLNPGALQAVWFVTPDVVRIFVGTPSNQRGMAMRTLEISEYDIRTRAYTKTGEYRKNAAYLLFSATADGTRLFVRNEGVGVTMLDARTAAELMSFPDLRGVIAMADGHLLGIGKNLRVMNAAGVVEREVPIDGELWIARAVAADKVLIGARAAGGHAHGWRLAVVNIATGAVIHREQDLEPLMLDQPSDARRMPVNPDQLFTDVKGNLIHWNVLTNEKNVVVSAKG